MLIGISGKIGSGKDTVGKIIQIITQSPHFTPEAVVDFLGRRLIDPDFINKKFADKLKDMVCLIIGCTREQLEDREFKEKELGEEWWRYKLYDGSVYRFVSKSKYTTASIKDKFIVKLTPRKLMQLLGTECGREILHPNVWVNALMSDCLHTRQIYVDGIAVRSKGLPNWVITDMRFPNELKAVEERDGLTIRVERDYVYRGGTEDPKQQHPSETALDLCSFDEIIDNNGSILELVIKVKEILIKRKII